MDNIFDLTGKRILVTGASSGFGAHFAHVLSAAGAQVVLVARRTDKLEQTAQAVRSQGGQAETVAMDVGSSESVAAAFAQIGSVDVVINNAGINAGADAHTLAESDWDAVLNTNLKGAFLVNQQAINGWVDAGKPGNIIHIASILGLRVSHKLVAYSASKAALVQMTKSLALDYARYKIRVNAICPGYVETDINRDFFQTDPGKALIKRVPSRRLGKIEELDGPLLLLASEASSYMTGSVIAVDGGHLCSAL